MKNKVRDQRCNGNRTQSLPLLYHFLTKISQVLEKDSCESFLEPGTGTKVT